MSSFFFRTHSTENHLSIECRESSATSVLLEVDFDSFLFLMNFLYFHVVSENTFFFFPFALEPKFLFLVVGKLCLPASWLEGKLWYGALLEFFFFFLSFFKYHQLTCLASAEAWDWPELCQTNTEVYLIVKRVPFPFLLHPCCHLTPRSYLLSSLLMSGSFGVMWWLFRFTWPSSPSPTPKYVYIHI